MFFRICDHAYDYTENEENDIYRKFKYQFDNLFNADEMPNNDKEFEEMYVHDEAFEKEFNEFLQLYSNSTKFCVGYTGIGKSTSIRHCLELGVSNVTRLKTRSKRSPNKYMIIFPTFLDGARQPIGDTFDFIGRVASVCTSLEEENPELRQILHTTIGREQFYHFVREHTPRILETKNDYEYDSLSPDDEIKLKLTYAQQNFKFEYYANKLKYYIMLTNSKYDQLVILLDDIETLPEQEQHTVITEYLHFFGCMNNTNIPEDTDYRIAMLISVRPHTLRLYRHRESVEMFRGLEAFSLATNTVLKKAPIELNVFFKNRFDYYTSRSPKVVGNRDTWDECYKGLMKLNDAFDGQYKSMIINLCFFNIRAALALYSKVFANRFWIQGNRTKDIFFTIDPQEYNFNNINVIRAIGCGNSAVFTGSDDSVIPNIFLTSEDMDYSIQCLLVMRYFIKTAGGENGNIKFAYGENAKELGSILQKWAGIFGEKRTEQFRSALVYLFEHKVLRKSIEDFDDIETMDKAESLSDDSKLYISPRGYELMSMLARDSVYFEMLRECAWRDYTGRENAYSCLPTIDLMLRKEQDILFSDLLEYIDYLRDQEESVFFDPDGKIDLAEYRNAFGSSMVSMHLLQGVERSIKYSGYMNNPDLKQKFLTVQRHIYDSTKRLQKSI